MANSNDDLLVVPAFGVPIVLVLVSFVCGGCVNGGFNWAQLDNDVKIDLNRGKDQTQKKRQHC